MGMGMGMPIHGYGYAQESMKDWVHKNWAGYARESMKNWAGYGGLRDRRGMNT